MQVVNNESMKVGQIMSIKKILIGKVTKVLKNQMVVVYVESEESAFECYSEETISVGSSVEITVKYFGPHNLGDKAAWIN
jgi:hypothetical protein